LHTRYVLATLDPLSFAFLISNWHQNLYSFVKGFALLFYLAISKLDVDNTVDKSQNRDVWEIISKSYFLSK
jgi:hypothetical protein